LRYASGDMDGAADIMLEFWKANPTAAVATVSNDLAVSLPIIEWLVKYCYSDRKLDGAILAELLANADLPGDAHWSDRALFLRDHADILIRNDRKMADDEEVHEFYEESLRAYERALEIAPKNPNYMNDLAVVLDYNLKRDLQRALALYDEANVIAKALMDDPETSQDDKDKFYSVALLDSGNNAKRLRRILEKREGKKGK
jgi:tetratricopeptide (TPR) repeat protein